MGGDSISVRLRERGGWDNKKRREEAGIIRKGQRRPRLGEKERGTGGRNEEGGRGRDMRVNTHTHSCSD